MSDFGEMRTLADQLKLIEARKCCDDEDNHYEDDTVDELCPVCKEHSNPVKCSECGEMVFQSACCG